MNTSNCITLLYDLLKDESVNGNTKIELIESWDNVLSLNLLKGNKWKNEIEGFAKELLEKRNEAKKNKDYTLADQIRNELEEKGYTIKDTREGSILERK